MSKTLFAMCLGIVSAMTISAHAQDNTKIAQNKVPTVAMMTANFFAPDIDFTRVGFEFENGEKVYEFEGHGQDGRHIEIDVLETGALQEIEMEIIWDEVPIAIQIELGLSNPQFEPKFIEASTRPDGTTVYEFEGVSDGKFADVEILETGTSIETLASL